MHPRFFILGMALCAFAKLATPEVSANAEATETLTTTQWAQSKLNFTATPKQAEVLDSTAKYLILCCSRQWGKTTTIAVKALHHAVTTPNQTILIISRTKHQAGILIHRACIFATQLGHRVRRVRGQSHSLLLPNQSQIFAVAHTTDTSVGNTANVLIVDEAALVKDEVFFSVSPSIGRTRGAIWLLSTPRRQNGFFYNIWHDEHPEWHKIVSPVSDCPEIDARFLEMQRRADETKYRQDFLCEFVQPPQFLFSRELIANLWSK